MDLAEMLMGLVKVFGCSLVVTVMAVTEVTVKVTVAVE